MKDTHSTDTKITWYIIAVHNPKASNTSNLFIPLGITNTEDKAMKMLEIISRKYSHPMSEHLVILDSNLNLEPVLKEIKKDSIV